MTELKPPTTEELLNVLRVHADAYPDSLSPFDVTVRQQVEAAVASWLQEHAA